MEYVDYRILSQRLVITEERKLVSLFFRESSGLFSLNLYYFAFVDVHITGKN
jgi:hypothetical protein